MNEMNKEIGIRWKNETEEVKKNYKDLATALKIQHQKENPGYKFRPKRRKLKKNTTGGELASCGGDHKPEKNGYFGQSANTSPQFPSSNKSSRSTNLLKSISYDRNFEIFENSQQVTPPVNENQANTNELFKNKTDPSEAVFKSFRRNRLSQNDSRVNSIKWQNFCESQSYRRIGVEAILKIANLYPIHDVQKTFHCPDLSHVSQTSNHDLSQSFRTLVGGSGTVYPFLPSTSSRDISIAVGQDFTSASTENSDFAPCKITSYGNLNDAAAAIITKNLDGDFPVINSTTATELPFREKQTLQQINAEDQSIQMNTMSSPATQIAVQADDYKVQDLCSHASPLGCQITNDMNKKDSDFQSSSVYPDLNLSPMIDEDNQNFHLESTWSNIFEPQTGNSPSTQELNNENFSTEGTCDLGLKLGFSAPMTNDTYNLQSPASILTSKNTSHFHNRSMEYGTEEQLSQLWKSNTK